MLTAPDIVIAYTRHAACRGRILGRGARTVLDDDGSRARCTMSTLDTPPPPPAAEALFTTHHAEHHEKLEQLAIYFAENFGAVTLDGALAAIGMRPASALPAPFGRSVQEQRTAAVASAAEAFTVAMHGTNIATYRMTHNDEYRAKCEAAMADAITAYHLSLVETSADALLVHTGGAATCMAREGA